VIIDVNPFIYSHPVSPEEIVDRDNETRELLTKAAGGHYVRLYAPRKYGKTSLLKRALLEGDKSEGFIPILVDLYGIGSIADVAIRIERAYAAALKGPIRAKIGSFLQKTGLGLSLGALGISAKLQLSPQAVEPLAALHALLDLPGSLEKEGGFRAFIAWDEFQDVNNIPNLDAILRAHIQHQSEVASYVFAGSEPGMLKLLFETKGRPLYGSAVAMRLGRLERQDLASYISRRFEQTKRSAGEALNPLLDAASGHPQRSMMLAHHLWEEVSTGDAATLEDWEAAHQSALVEVDAEFDATWRGLRVTEQKTLRSIIAGDGSAYRERVLDRLALEKAAAQAAVKRLTDSADIEPDGRKHRVVDPLFAEWIERLNAPPLVVEG
jgi:uncharacterized protein